MAQQEQERTSIDVSALEDDVHRTKSQIEEANAARLEANEKLRELSSTAEDLNAEESRKKSRLKNLQSQSYKIVNRLSRNLGRSGQDAAKAFELVQQMKNSNMFSGNVYGPLIAEIKVENAFHARCVEHFIPNSRKTTFVAENEKDYRLLNKRLKERNIKVPVAHANRQNFTRNIDGRLLHAMRQGGISGLMEDIVEAPPAVKAVLNHFAGLDRVVFSENDLSGSIDSSASTWLEGCNSFNVYYTKQDSVIRFDVRRSSYSGKATTTSQEVPPPRILGGSEASEDLDSLQAELAQVRERLQAVSQQKESCHDEVRQVDANRQLLQKQLEALKVSLKRPALLSTQIKNTRAKIEKLEEELAKDSDQAKAGILAEIRQLCVDSRNAIQAMQTANREHVDNMALATHTGALLKVVEAQHEAIAAQYEDARSGFSQLQTAFTQSKAYLKRP